MTGENTEVKNEDVDKDKVAATPVLPDGKPAPDDKATPPVDAEDKDAKDDKSSGVSCEDDKGGDDQPKEYDKEVWGTTGDDVGDSVLQLLSDSGVSVDDAKALLFDPVQSGDATKIDRDALVEKVGKAQANLILAGVENFVSKRNAQAEVAVKSVHDAAGGKQAWDTVLPWLNSKAVSEDERTVYRDMIDKGGKSAELAVKDIVSKYNADPNNKSLGKREVLGDARSNTQDKGISQKEYGDRLLLLQRKGQVTERARKELLAKRRLGRQQGL